MSGFNFSLFLIGVIRLGAYAALFAPLIVHPDFFFPFVVPKTLFFWMFTEVIFASWVLLALSNKQFRPRVSALPIAFGAFLLVAIFTSFTGVDTARSFWSTYERMAGVINWLHLAMFFSALAFTFRTVEEWKKLLSVSLLVASFVSLIFLLQRWGVTIIPFETKGGSTIGNSSFMAAYLLFNVFFGVWLFAKARGFFLKVLYGTGLGVVIYAILVATAYGALVSMFGGFFIMFLAWLFFGQKIHFARTIAASLLFASIFIVGIIIWGTFTQSQGIVNKLPYFFSDGGTIGARKVIWQIAVSGVKERPILGWGPENFGYAFTKYFNPCLPLSECGGEVWFDRTHNVILDHLINSGIIGLLSYLALFVSALFLLWRNFLHTRDDPARGLVLSDPERSEGESLAPSEVEGKDWVLPSVVTAALASYFAQNVLVFDMPNTYIMFTFTLAFVARFADKSSVSNTTEKSTETVRLYNPRPMAIGVVGIIFLYYFFSFGIQSAQAAYWSILINRGGLSPQDRIALYEKSLSASPLGNRQTPEFITNNLSQAINKQELDPLLVTKAAEIMEQSVADNPGDFRQNLLLGNFYTAAREFNPDYLKKAENIIRQAVELSPTNQLGYISLSQTYMFQNRALESIAALEKAVDLEPRYGRAHKILSDVYRTFGLQEKSEESLRRVRELGL